MRLRCAVVTTHARPGDYRDCVVALAQQTDFLCTVAHGDEAVAYVFDVLQDLHPLFSGVQVIPYHGQPPNISRMWNLGLDAMPYITLGEPYDVAVLNDDAVVPPDWFDRVTDAMREGGAAAGAVRRSFDPRMAGYAFVLDGDKGIRADEQFRWWYGDDDIARQARALGGVALADGADVEHRHPNSTTVGVLADVAKDDRGRYKRKWGLHAP